MTTVTNCLECGAEIPAEAQGLCPKCLLKLGLASQLSPGFIETGARPPPFLRFDPSDPTKPGTLEPFEFGGYRILRLLGKGGMGAVYEAEDLASGRHVALKVLGHSLDSADTRKRFIREGRLAASINHPNSVYVYGTEEIEGAPVITMELVPGGTLHERVKTQGPLPTGEAVDAVLQIIAGLEAAHAVGILHRDIKPSNCFLEPNGTVKIGDFGLSISTLARGDSAITLAGSFLGTPEFSSPEQLRGEALDLRADIYSVGMTLYYLLVGKTPFHAENMVALLATVLDKPASSPRVARPDIPEPLARLILRCLAKQAGDRPGTYDELRRALFPFASTAPAPATLGLRFIAGVLDHIAITAMNTLVPLLAVTNVAEITDPATFRTARWFWLGIGTLVFQFAYYCVPEGIWGASLGKMLMGLRVGQLNRTAPGIPRAALRALIFMLPVLFTFVWSRAGMNTTRVTIWNMSSALVLFAWPALLALSARRRNGFATAVDLASKTRVIQRSAYEPRAKVGQLESPVAATDALPQIGPYHVLAPLGGDDDGRLILGYDTRLLRRLWIRQVSAGTPAVAVEWRNVARPGRLRWLQGRRDEAEAWDAYEAASGVPLTSLLAAPQPWRQVRHWLHDLATELATASGDGSLPVMLSIDRAWITAEGHAKLLDFPAPGANPVAEATADPAVFLNWIAISALEGRMASLEEARERDVSLPVPVPARAVLREMRAAENLETLSARLTPLTRSAPDVSRSRRFGLVAGCLVPGLIIAAVSYAGLKAAESWKRQYPEVEPLRRALTAHSWMAGGMHLKDLDPKATLEPLEIYIASRHGKLIRDSQAWSSLAVISSIPAPLRSDAERFVAAHPEPTAAEMESARAALAPAFDSQGNLNLLPDSPELKSASLEVLAIGAGGAFVWAAFFSVAAALVCRGGLLMRAFGMAAVCRDGEDASRLRMLCRACVAWSWMPLAIATFLLLKDSTGVNASIAIVTLLLAAGVAWSSLLPKRSIQDRLAGVWLVPR